MKTSQQIYDEVESRWAEENAERRKKRQSRTIDVLSFVLPLAVFFVWALIEHQILVISICPPVLAGAVVQFQKQWRLEDRIERLEKEIERRGRP
jgi:hypothetical protein